MNTPNRIKRGEPFTKVVNGRTMVTPIGMMIYATDTVRPNGKGGTALQQRKAQALVDGVIDRAKANGCADFEKLMVGMMSEVPKHRIDAAESLLSWMTGLEFQAVFAEVGEVK